MKWLVKILLKIFPRSFLQRVAGWGVPCSECSMWDEARSVRYADVAGVSSCPTDMLFSERTHYAPTAYR